MKGVQHGTGRLLRGRSVVIHWGDRVGEAFPGQPNNRMACGVLEWAEAPQLLRDGNDMGLLDDRRILITGVLSNRSIAYGVARACAARRRAPWRSPTSTTI